MGAVAEEVTHQVIDPLTTYFVQVSCLRFPSTNIATFGIWNPRGDHSGPTSSERASSRPPCPSVICPICEGSHRSMP